MNKIQRIMRSKKFWPILIAVIAASSFIAFQTIQAKGQTGDPKEKNERILYNMGVLLEQVHYSPRKIDDDFSKLVLNRFENDLDGDKSIFLLSDINSFKKYQTRIDDEIHNTVELESFYTISQVYDKRIQEAAQIYNEILSKPFDYSKDENVVLDGDKLTYPKSESERKEIWRKRLKYLALARYSDMLDERTKNKDKKDFVYKADTTLERESREQVKKQIGRYFTTIENHNTEDELFSTFMNSIAKEMDPHTDYFPPVDARSFNEEISGSFFGIGAQLKEDDSKITIASLVTGGPAWKSNQLQPDDEILKIGEGNAEPVDVTGYAVSDAVKLIRGSEKGSEVRLTIRKPDGTIKVVSLLRDQIKLDDKFARSAVINGLHKIGYIYLPEFYADYDHPDGARCSDDVAREVKKLEAENVEGIIIDLRDNGGGSLQEVVKMAGLFISKGPICQVKGRDDKPSELKDVDDRVLYSGPLTVMVNENSASASEIFAASIQDYQRGLIVGSTSTYGKGTVQRPISLNPEAETDIFNKTAEDLGTVKITMEKFYRINGGATQLKGVSSDVVIPDRLEYEKIREKDNPSALTWDEIPKADYKPWVTTYSSSLIANEANQEIDSSSTFKHIKLDIDWINIESDKEYSLNIDKYRAEQKKLKDTYHDLDSLLKPVKKLDVTNLAIDLPVYTVDKEKADKNKDFLDRLKDDLYVDETIKVMNNMIGQGTMVKSN
jgi:carboxyl-terminal processing protease